eukprot:767932-Hanusia_phi.AAC.3
MMTDIAGTGATGHGSEGVYNRVYKFTFVSSTNHLNSHLWIIEAGAGNSGTIGEVLNDKHCLSNREEHQETAIFHPN